MKDSGGSGQAPGGATASSGAYPGGTSTPGNASGVPGRGDGGAQGNGTGGAGNGPLGPAEQGAILDAELEQGTGDFDDMILDTQREQQQRQQEAAQRSGAGGGPTSAEGPGGATGGGSSDADTKVSVYEPDSGIGNASSRRDAPPVNTAKYPPPDDIPNGDDDDVVARQLRELAMSEPDPAVRERLWDEYRKYKGID